MQKKVKVKKVVPVREHPRHVPVSKKNPEGITIVDRHSRNILGTKLCHDEINDIAKNYDLKDVIFPAAGKLAEFANADNYDKTIAVWTDYFNKKYKDGTPMDPDMVKALIASESSFKEDAINKNATGITQITKETLKILQDPKGEAKDFMFCKTTRNDLKNPDLSIPMAIRWLFYKKASAERKLKRAVTHEDIIVEYKGWTNKETVAKKKAVTNYMENYGKLKIK